MYNFEYFFLWIQYWSTHIITLLSKCMMIRRGHRTWSRTDPCMGETHLPLLSYGTPAWMMFMESLYSLTITLNVPLTLCFPPLTLELPQSCQFDHLRRLSKVKDRKDPFMKTGWLCCIHTLPSITLHNICLTKNLALCFIGTSEVSEWWVEMNSMPRRAGCQHKNGLDRGFLNCGTSSYDFCLLSLS